MDSSPQLLLNVWRGVSRHILIDESVTRVMPLLSPELPLDALLVRHVDLARTTLETVAAAMVRPGQAPGRAKTECTPEDLDRILAWCREGPLLRAGDRPIQKQLPGLLPAGEEKETATKSGEYRRKKRRQPPVTVASLRLFLRPSTGPNRPFQPQSLGRVRDPVRI